MMKKLFVLLLSLVLLQNSAPVRGESGKAKSPEFLYVQAEELFAYAEPSEDSEVKLGFGEGVCIPVAEVGEDGWYGMPYEAEDGSEQIAWVHNTEAGELSTEPVLPEDGYKMYVVEEADILAEPFPEAEVLETKERGEAVTVRGMTFDGEWSGVSCSPAVDAEIGWIRADATDSIFWDEAGVVEPGHYLIDPSMPEDGIYAAAFPRENLMNIGEGLTLVDAEIFTADIYDIVDISTLEPGMYLYMDGEYMKVESKEESDAGLEINGGYYEGGCTLVSREDTNGWQAVIEDDQTTYTSHGKGTLVLSDDAVFTDSSDPEGEVVTAAGINEIMPLFESMDHGDFNRYNTRIRVEGGKIVEIIRTYMP